MASPSSVIMTVPDIAVSSEPLVSIVTPVYNEAQYIGECIESVLAQTYQNWDYTIVDNCSTDGSFEIASRYAAQDSRIKVVKNSSFLRIIPNHNEAMRQITPDAKYCKVVFADDWLYPTCVEEMVKVIEQNPSVGMVGAYTMDGESVMWAGPAYPGHRITGKDVCKNKLLGAPYMFGTMTCVLLRSDLVRKRTAFFNEKNLHADLEACFEVLLESDFGFVHQVLTYSRPREQSNGSFAKDFGSIMLGEFVSLLKYGPVLLPEAEYKRRFKTVRWEYYQVLAHNALRLRAKEFWKYHQDTLAAFNSRISYRFLALAVAAEIGGHLAHPLQSIKHGWYWWSNALNRRLKPRSA